MVTNGVSMSVALVSCPKHETATIALAWAGDHFKGRFELTPDQATNLASGLLSAVSQATGDEKVSSRRRVQVPVKRISVPPQAAYGDDRVRLLVIDCPFCGQEHFHGGGRLSEDVGGYYGSRAAHCDADGDYELIPA